MERGLGNSLVFGHPKGSGLRIKMNAGVLVWIKVVQEAGEGQYHRGRIGATQVVGLPEKICAPEKGALNFQRD